MKRLHFQHLQVPQVVIFGGVGEGGEVSKANEFLWHCDSRKKEISYQRVGILIYPAVVYQPETSNAATFLRLFSQNPVPKHIQEVDYVMVYAFWLRSILIQLQQSHLGSSLV